MKSCCLSPQSPSFNFVFTFPPNVCVRSSRFCVIFWALRRTSASFLEHFLPRVQRNILLAASNVCVLSPSLSHTSFLTFVFCCVLSPVLSPFGSAKVSSLSLTLPHTGLCLTIVVYLSVSCSLCLSHTHTHSVLFLRIFKSLCSLSLLPTHRSLSHPRPPLLQSSVLSVALSPIFSPLPPVPSRLYSNSVTLSSTCLCLPPVFFLSLSHTHIHSLSLPVGRGHTLASAIHTARASYSLLLGHVFIRKER